MRWHRPARRGGPAPEASPGKQGQLFAALEVTRLGAAASGNAADEARFRALAPRLLGREVGEYRWAARAPRLAWLEQYDPRSRSGVLGVGGAGARPRTFGGNVSDFELSADGRHVAFLRHTAEGGYSVNLELAEVDGPAEAAPRRVTRGAFGFAFSPDGRWLYYRTSCARQAESCDLERIPAAAGGQPAAPQAIAQGIKSFEFDPRDPERLLITWLRTDQDALDLALWQGGALVTVDQGALPGSARFLGPDSRRLAYAVAQPKRAGAWVATLPP